MLNSVLVNKNNPTHIFVLAADWDNKFFFKELLREKPKGSDLEDVMCKLLLKNSFSYVEVLLDNGVNLLEVVKQIPDLELTDIMENEIVAHLMHHITSGNQNLSRAEVENKIGKLLCIWGAYKGMTDMAKVFWREGKDYLAMALMAYQVSKEQKKKLSGKEECNAMREQMKNFETLSTSFLLTCDTASRQNTIALLRGRVPDLKQKTPMQIAFDGDFKEFVAQPSFQVLLDQISAKRIVDYSKKKYIPLTVSIFCPFAAPTLFEYNEDDKHRENLDEHSPTMRSFLYFFRRVRSFLNAPVIKFVYNTLTYLAYLVLFSIVMLTDFRTKGMSPLEIALTIWTFILIIEECRQVSIFRKEYLNKWNLFDVLALTLYAVGFILRIIHLSFNSICPACLYVARIVLAFSLLLSILRVLQLLSINPILGPKIYMISRLLKDLISFMIIMAVVISAYGVVSNVILYPNQPLNGKLLKDVFNDAWWSLLGEFNRDDTIGLNCNATISVEYCSNTTRNDIDYQLCKQNRCPANTWIVSVLLAFYALLTVIMMLNVLIAMFNISFATVEGKQKRVSKMQRYRLIREYHFRSMLPAPLCVLSYLKYVPWLCKLCKYCCFTEDDYRGKMYFPPLEPSTNIFSKSLVPAITIWEQNMREKYEEEIRIRQLSAIGAMVPTGKVYNMVLHNPNYVNTLMQYSISQMEQRLSVQLSNIFRRNNEESEFIASERSSTDYQRAKKEARNETNKVPPRYGYREGDRSGFGRDYTNYPYQFGRNRRPMPMYQAPATGKSRTQRSFSSRPAFNGNSPPEFRVPSTDYRPAEKEYRYETNKVPPRYGYRDGDRSRFERDYPNYPYQFGRNRRPMPMYQAPATRKASAQRSFSSRPAFNGNSPPEFRVPSTETQRTLPKPTMSNTHPTQPRPRRIPPKPQKSVMEGHEKSCIYQDYCYEIEQDDQSRRGRRKKRRSKSVKAYPGRYHLSKPTCSNSDCKMIIKCRDGRVIELETPFRNYGVPPKSSTFPAYRLPLKKSDIRKVNFECQQFPKDSMRAESRASTTREVKIRKIRMPYGGVVLPPDKDDSVRVLFDHHWHRGKSVPVVLSESPPQAESVKVIDVRKKAARRRGEIATFLPNKKYNPELHSSTTLHHLPPEGDIQ